MTTTNTASAVHRHVAAFNDRDLAALMAGFTEDVVWITGTTVVEGHGALAELFAAAMAGLLPTLTVHNLVVEGDRAACELVETVTFEGDEQVFSIAGFYRVRDGRIAAAKIYREGSAEIS